MKHTLLFFVFLLFFGPIKAQQSHSAVVQLGSERGIYWRAFSPYFGAEYQYNVFPNVRLYAGLGYVNDRVKTYGGANSEFHRVRSTQPYAGIQMAIWEWGQHQRLSVSSGLKIIALRMNYVSGVQVDARDPDDRTVTRFDYNVNQPVSTFSVQDDYHFSERLFAGLQLQLDYLLQREDLEPLSTSYVETSGFGSSTASSTHSPQSLWRFTLRMGYKF